MTAPIGGVGTDPRPACHAMLLRLAGRLPDEFMAEARHWLAIGRLDHIARTVPVAAVALQVPLTDVDLDVLRDLATRYRLDTAKLESVERRGPAPDPHYRFAPAPLPWKYPGGPVERPALRPGSDVPAADDLDRAVVGVVSATDSAG
jgi:hypothetical protein